MPSIINSDDGVVSGTSGLKTTGGNDGITAFQQNGTERMRIDSSGNVGIGTTSTSSIRLHVDGGSTANALTLNSTTNTYLQFRRSGTNVGYIQTSPTGLFLVNEENQPLVLGSNGTERMRINAGAPILCLSGGNTTATGTGIAFPATQSASTDANTLDDYEEGTFTPTFFSGITSITYANQNGFYTKVGRLVNFTLRINISAGTGNGTIIDVGGLPFTSNSTNGYFSSAVFGYASNALVNSTSTNLPTLYLAPSDTKISFYKTNGTNFTSSDCADVTKLDLYISGFFFTS